MYGNVAINFFGVGALELGVRADADALTIEKAFWTFLGRPRHPHLSMLDADRPEVHFTEGNRKSGRMRRFDVVRTSKAAAEAWGAQLGHRAYDRTVPALEPVTLADMQEQGWLVHGLAPEAVERWIRLAARRPEFRIDITSTTALVRHFMRGAYWPTSLADFAVGEYLSVICLREVDGRVETAILQSKPDGLFRLPPEGGDGIPERVGEPGWYLLRMGPPAGCPYEDLISPEAVKRMFAKVEDALKRCPSKEASDPLEALRELPAFASIALGFYASRLLMVAMRSRLAYLASRPRARTTSPAAQQRGVGDVRG